MRGFLDTALRLSTNKQLADVPEKQIDFKFRRKCTGVSSNNDPIASIHESAQSYDDEDDHVTEFEYTSLGKSLLISSIIDIRVPDVPKSKPAKNGFEFAVKAEEEVAIDVTMIEGMKMLM